MVGKCVILLLSCCANCLPESLSGQQCPGTLLHTGPAERHCDWAGSRQQDSSVDKHLKYSQEQTPRLT